jgi:hypothetical protein
MTLFHIEGFDLINSTTKSALGGIDMSHQGQTSMTGGDTPEYAVAPGTLTEFDVAGRYAGSSGLKLNFEQHTGRTTRTEDGVTTNYTGNHGTWSRIPFTEQQALGSFTFGFAFKTSAINSSHDTCIAAIADSDGKPLLLLTYNTSAYLKAYLFNNTNADYANTFRSSYASSPSSATVLTDPPKKQRNFVQNEYVNAGGSTVDHSALGTGSNAISVDTWYTIECQVVENSSKNYDVEVRLDDAIQVNSDGNAVSNNQCANLHEVILLNALLLDHASLDSQMAESSHTFDDFYFLDDATSVGGATNNTFLGADMRVQALSITGSGSVDFNAMTVDSGTASGNLIDFSTSTTTILEKPGSGLFDISNLSTIKTAKGVRYVAVAKEAVGEVELDFLTKTNGAYHFPSGAIHDGSSMALTGSFVAKQEIQEKNPATNNDYTQAELNALQIGLKAS